MSNSISKYKVILDINFEYIERAVEFLNQANKEIGWTVNGMRKKLSDENPAGKGYLALAVFNNKVIGTASLTKKIVLLYGIKVKAAEVGDTYTDPLYRRNLQPFTYYGSDENPESYVNKSIFGRLLSEVRDAALAEGVEIVYGTPNENSYPGYTKYLGFMPTENYKINSYCKYKLSFILKKIAQKFNLKFKNKLPNNVGVNKNIKKQEYENLISRVYGNHYDLILSKNYDYINYRYLINRNDYFYEKYYSDDVLKCIIIYRIKSINNINYIFIAELICDDHKYANKYIKKISIIKYIDAVVIWTDDSTYKKLQLNKNLFSYRNNIPLIIYNNNKIIHSKHMSFGMGCTDNV